MKRFFFLFSGAVLMLVVAVLAAFASMRLAIHGSEIDVPNLAGLSDSDAAATAHKLGLDLSVENRFYSGAIAPNHILSQSPEAGSLVRRGSQVRVTESLGAQQLNIPDLAGQTERPASLVLKRLQLDLGSTAHLPTSVPEGVVIAQSPPPNSIGIAGPRVSLLVSAPETASSAQGYVMPQIVGMTLATANGYLGSVGLHIASATDPQAVADAAAEAATAEPAQTTQPAQPTQDPAIPPNTVPAAAPQPTPPSPDAVITSQSPAPGHRVSRAEAIRVTVAHPADPAALDTSGTSSLPPQ